MHKISIITPSVRFEGLDIVRKSLEKQIFKDWEWIIVCPASVAIKLNPSHHAHQKIRMLAHNIMVVIEPDKNEGDMYSLNKSWNEGFRMAHGELVISFVDMTWAPPDALENFWIHYENNPKAVIGGIGHQYEKVIDGKPEILIWQDPRAQTQYGSFWEINPIDMELCLTSIPKQAIIDIGGFDETFDQYAALSEKEACLRMDKLGYKFFLDNTIEYRALTHPRLTKDWDQRYEAGLKYFHQCIREINDGIRLKLDYLGA